MESTFTEMPKAEFEAILAILTEGKDCIRDKESSVFTCSAFTEGPWPQIWINLGIEHYYFLNEGDYVNVQSDGKFQLLFKPASDPEKIWRLGKRFLENYYQVYDITNQRIALSGEYLKVEE